MGVQRQMHEGFNGAAVDSPRIPASVSQGDSPLRACWPASGTGPGATPAARILLAPRRIPRPLPSFVTCSVFPGVRSLSADVGAGRVDLPKSGELLQSSSGPGMKAALDLE